MNLKNFFMKLSKTNSKTAKESNETNTNNPVSSVDNGINNSLDHESAAPGTPDDDLTDIVHRESKARLDAILEEGLVAEETETASEPEKKSILAGISVGEKVIYSNGDNDGMQAEVIKINENETFDIIITSTSQKKHGILPKYISKAN